MYVSNYDKNPQIIIKDFDHPAVTGWKAITGAIDREVIARNKKRTIIAVETYPGTADMEVLGAFLAGPGPALCIRAGDLYKSEEEINSITFPDVTDDRIFGFMTSLTIIDFLDRDKLEQARKNLDKVRKGTVLLYGCGASEISSDIDIFIYSDLTRFEIQQRMRRKELANLGTTDYELEISRKYKRAFFVDWRVADRIKIKTCSKWDFVLDTNKPDAPVMITAGVFMNSLEVSARRPFRLVPFLIPGPGADSG
jgi:predicted nucleotidyltransferase